MKRVRGDAGGKEEVAGLGNEKNEKETKEKKKMMLELLKSGLEMKEFV